MDDFGFRQHTISTPYMVGPVHCYSGFLQGEPVLFDTGPPTEEAKQYLAENIDLGGLRHVFITHSHIDHYGLAYWLEENSDATVYLPRRDCLKILHHEKRIEGITELLRETGLAEQYIDMLHRVFESGVLFPPFPKRYQEAETAGLSGLNILPCPGHSQADLVYHGDGWMVTGDTLLHGIFQCPLLDIDLEQGGRYNNYEAYCRTIVGLFQLAGKKVMPGHRFTIPGISQTIGFYVEKMLQRAAQLYPLRHEKDIMRLLATLFGERMQDAFFLYLKISEIVFMLDFLARPELLARSLSEIGLYEELAPLFPVDQSLLEPDFPKR